MTLYIKSGCPWCVEAESWLKSHGYEYDVIDVLRDSAGFTEMKRISGQTRAPTMMVNELVLADFDTDQLEAFLEKNDITPESV